MKIMEIKKHDNGWLDVTVIGDDGSIVLVQDRFSAFKIIVEEDTTVNYANVPLSKNGRYHYKTNTGQKTILHIPQNFIIQNSIPNKDAKKDGLSALEIYGIYRFVTD